MSENVDILKLENQLCFPLYAASREIIKQYTPHLNEIGLTYTQYIVMLVLWEKREVGAKKLGELLYLDSGTITPVVKKLEQMGLLKRVRSTQDERTLTIVLTNQGEALKEKAHRIPEKIADCVKLNKEEAVMLYQLLYTLLGNFRSE